MKQMINNNLILRIMKKMNLFRMLAIVTMFTLATNGAFAQGLTTTGTASVIKTGPNFPADNEYIDMVTVGSKMPYQVTPDPTVAAMVDNVTFFPSVFNWTVTGVGNALELPASHTGLTPDDNANGTPVYAGFFKESSVAVQWGATVGDYTISVSEQAQNNAGLPACAGAAVNLDAWVMAKPIVSFDEAATPLVNGTLNIIGTPNDGILGGCGLSGASPVDVLLAVDLTGTDQYQVSYKTDYYPLIGAPVMGSFAFTPTKFDDGTHTFLSVSGPASPNTGTVSNNNEIKVTIPANTYGKWVVTLQGVNDRVSRKSFSALPTPDLGTVGATASLTIYSMPTPTTQPIQHVTNLGW
jgi:hypothetical protein